MRNYQILRGVKPPSTAQIADFYNRIATRYHEQRLTDQKLFGDFIERPAVLRCLKSARSGGRLLDIGCGSGLYSKTFAEAGFQVTGIDVSSAMIEIATTYCRGTSALFLNTAFQNHEAPSRSVDVVFGSFLPGYITDLRAAFSRISRWLAPGGLVVLSMVHPVRAASVDRTSDSYLITDYFDRGIYNASILRGEERFPLVRHLFSDLIDASRSSGLVLMELLEPVPEHPPVDIESDLYYKCPSLAVLSFRPAEERAT